jgi:ABC-type multidrug transport system permease subunit
MGRFTTLVRKDMRVITRNRGLLVTLLLYPLILVAVVGLVFADPSQPVPVGVVIGEEGNKDVTIGDETFSLEEVLSQLEAVAHVTRYDTRQGAIEGIRNGDQDAVIVFPSFFLVDLLQDFRTQVRMEVILDRSDPAKSVIAENIIRAGVQGFNEDIVRWKVEEVVGLLEIALEGGEDQRFSVDMSFREMRRVIDRVLRDEPLSPENRARLEDARQFLDDAIFELENSADTISSITFPIRTEVSHIDSGVLAARDIVVPATVALSVFWTGILATASLVVYERQSYAQLRLNVTPVRPGLILASKLFVAAVIILVQSGLIIGVAKLLWNIRLDNFPLLLVVLLAASFAAVGFGLLVAGLSRDTNGSTLLSVLAVFPMMFLSGLFFPVSFMPTFAQFLARLMPLTYAVDGLRGAMLRDYAWVHAQTDVVVLIILGAVTITIGHVRNRRLARMT